MLKDVIDVRGKEGEELIAAYNLIALEVLEQLSDKKN